MKPGKKKDTSGEELRKAVEELAKIERARYPATRGIRGNMPWPPPQPPSGWTSNPPWPPNPIPIDQLTLNMDTSAEHTNCLVCKVIERTEHGPNVVVLGDLETMDTIDFRCCDEHLDIIRSSHKLIKWDEGTKHGDMYEIERAPDENPL